MSLEIKTKDTISGIKITNLDKDTVDYEQFDLQDRWYKVTIPGTRYSITDVLIHNESIKHCINSGTMTEHGYELWIHGDLSKYFSRIAECIAQDDLLRFKDLSKKYLLCESWNEYIEGDFIPKSVRDFFANGEGPHWYHRSDKNSLPYETFDGVEVATEIGLDDDLLYKDSKFYGQGNCKSLKSNPVLPTIKVDELKNDTLKNAMRAFGYTELLQVQHVEIEPNSVLPVHRDDFTYEDGRSIIDGPTQLYFVLTGSKDDIKFKFKNVGLIDVSKPIFINNHRFVHSLVYTGSKKRGVLLAYGIRTN